MAGTPKTIDSMITPRVNVATASQYLGVSARTLQRMIIRREIAALDVSRPGARRPVWSIKIDDLRTFIITAELAGERRLAEAKARAEEGNCSDRDANSDTCDTGRPKPSRGRQA